MEGHGTGGGTKDDSSDETSDSLNLTVAQTLRMKLMKMNAVMAWQDGCERCGCERGDGLAGWV